MLLAEGCNNTAKLHNQSTKELSLCEGKLMLIGAKYKLRCFVNFHAMRTVCHSPHKHRRKKVCDLQVLGYMAQLVRILEGNFFSR